VGIFVLSQKSVLHVCDLQHCQRCRKVLPIYPVTAEFSIWLCCLELTRARSPPLSPPLPSISWILAIARASYTLSKLVSIVILSVRVCWVCRNASISLLTPLPTPINLLFPQTKHNKKQEKLNYCIKTNKQTTLLDRTKACFLGHRHPSPRFVYCLCSVSCSIWS